MNWSTECFKTDCEHNLLKEIIFKKISSIQHICTILIFQYVSKATFLNFTNYKSDIFHFASFSRCSSPVVSPRCDTPIVSRRPRLPSECNEVPEIRISVVPLSLSTNAVKRARVGGTPTRSASRPTRCITELGSHGWALGCYNGETQREKNNGKMMQNEKCHFYSFHTF